MNAKKAASLVYLSALNVRDEAIRLQSSIGGGRSDPATVARLRSYLTDVSFAIDQFEAAPMVAADPIKIAAE